MAVSDENHLVITSTTRGRRETTIERSWKLLEKLDEAIFALMEEGVRSFSLNTGMTTQNVTNQDLPVLIQRRKDLFEQIKMLESLNPPPALKTQVVPAW